MNWNVNVEHDFGSHLSAQLGYVGSHTVHQSFTADDNNQVLPTSVNGVLVWPGPKACNGGPCPVANPNVGALYSIFYDNSVKYDGLQAQLRVRASHGLQGQAVYIWSKCLDAGSGGGISDPFVNSLSTLIYFNKAGRQGPCDFDIRHNFAKFHLRFAKPEKSSIVRLGGGRLASGGNYHCQHGCALHIVPGR